MVRAFRSGVLAMAFVVVAVTCGTASAHSSLTKPQYIARGDAICGAAAAQVAKLGTLNRPLLAKYGYKWLAIDRNALSALRGLAPPAADRATAARLLALADAAINKGVAGVVAAAKSGTNAQFFAAEERASVLINTAHAGARAYGFRACATW